MAMPWPMENGQCTVLFDDCGIWACPSIVACRFYQVFLGPCSTEQETFSAKLDIYVDSFLLKK